MGCYLLATIQHALAEDRELLNRKGHIELNTLDESGDEDTPETTSPSASTSAAEWKPLTAKQRRVLGTLMEKSKTTPDAYPMTYSGICTGANQKSNRAPISNYSIEQIESIVDEMRPLGALTIVQGLGRVTKVRHYAYQWLGINKVEAAIMTELLLRGEQTLGELRTRASRMEPIADMQQMTEMFAELKRRGLVVELSPPGRGQVVSHNLYPEWELEQVRKSVAAGLSASAHDEDDSPRAERGNDAHRVGMGDAQRQVQQLESEMMQLKAVMTQLAQRLDRIEKEFGIE
jgi:uncharacterized protein YceH (UPF0502 family)